MNNVKFERGEYIGAVYGLNQWDSGQYLRITGLDLPPNIPIYYSLQEKGGESIPKIGTTVNKITTVEIPSFIFEKDSIEDYKAYAFVYVINEDSTKTEHKIILNIKAEPKPESYCSPEYNEMFKETINVVNKLTQESKDASIQSKSYAVGGTNTRENEDLDNSKYYYEQSKINSETTNADKDFVEQAKQEIEDNKNIVAQDKQDVSQIKVEILDAESKIKQSELNAKQSEDNSKLSEANAKLSENNALKSKEEVESIKLSVDTTKSEIDKITDQIDKDKGQISLDREQVNKDKIEVSKNKDIVLKTKDDVKLSEINAKKSETNSSLSERNTKISEENVLLNAQNIDNTKKEIDDIKQSVDNSEQNVVNLTQGFDTKVNDVTQLIQDEGQTQLNNLQNEVIDFEQDRQQINVNKKDIEDLKNNGTGVKDYNELMNKPSINGIELIGNRDINEITLEEKQQIVKNKDDILKFAIKPEASGNPIVLKDSADFPILSLELNGSTTQMQTTGKNLFDISKVKEYQKLTVVNNKIVIKDSYSTLAGKFKELFPNVIQGKRYKIFFKTTSNFKFIYLTAVGSWSIGQSKVVTEQFFDAGVSFYGNNEQKGTEIISEIMLIEDGISETPYEPYSGGLPSPSPNYPQPIVNSEWDMITNTNRADKGFTETLEQKILLSEWDKIKLIDGVWKKENNTIGIILNNDINNIKEKYLNDLKTKRYEIQQTKGVIQPSSPKFKGEILCDKFIASSVDDQFFDRIQGDSSIGIEPTGALEIYDKKIQSLKDMRDFIANNNIFVLCKTINPIYETLAKEVQDLLNKITTFYPNTVLQTNEGITLDLKYVADTKNYIDGKIANLQKVIFEK